MIGPAGFMALTGMGANLPKKNKELEKQEATNAAASQQNMQNIQSGFNMGDLLAKTNDQLKQPQGVGMDGGPGFLPPMPDNSNQQQGGAPPPGAGGLGPGTLFGGSIRNRMGRAFGNTPLQEPQSPMEMPPIPAQEQAPSFTDFGVEMRNDGGVQGLPAPSPPAQGQGVVGQEQQQTAPQQFNPLDNFFTGTLQDPNGLLRLSEGYNRGGLVGGLGMLGTDMSGQANQTGVQDRIKRARQGGY